MVVMLKFSINIILPCKAVRTSLYFTVVASSLCEIIAVKQGDTTKNSTKEKIWKTKLTEKIMDRMLNLVTVALSILKVIRYNQSNNSNHSLKM